MSAPLDTSEHFLSPEEERLLLRIARDALCAWVRERRRVDVEEYPLTPSLRERHGAFVTLRNRGDLRGCIGYTVAREPLAEAVRDNAINAAANDPRFSPVAPSELDDLTVEISALTPGDEPGSPFRRVDGPGDIVIGRDGLFIEMPGSRGGLLLPQVAVEQDWDVATFLAHTCRKAGYSQDAWKRPEARILRFSAQVFSEQP
jgi:uncharacterized protein